MHGYKAGNRTVEQGDDIIRQGEPCSELYTLLDGWAMVYQDLANGRRQVLDFALPGALLGFRPNLEAPPVHSVQALTDASMCVFPRARFLALVREQPEVGLRLAWMTARDHFLAQEHLTNLGRRNAAERIAYLLLEIYLRAARTWPAAGGSIAMPLTQEHLGDALGLTAVHVNRTLGRLRRQGLLELGGRTLVVRDAEALAALAGFEPEALHRQIGDDALARGHLGQVARQVV